MTATSPIYTVENVEKSVDLRQNEVTYSAYVRIDGVGYPLTALFRSPALFRPVSLHYPGGLVAYDDVRHLVHDEAVTKASLIALRETFGAEL